MKGSIIPNKVIGDVPLAPSAQNISKISTDMPIPISKDEGKAEKLLKLLLRKKEQAHPQQKLKELYLQNQKAELT
ncbi:hypothetical protein H5410_013826 [Solanum commersonii]|uniref:Uncharacterized protein n=1 Tax=Solanum commersonii TaxID=4109 RepID=A0A9J5ZPK0_SOLCO|nr:hypothetical protein H5410_013826 [Solanum commersonii]